MPKTKASKTISFCCWHETPRFFKFALMIEGTTEKMLQFTMPLKSIYNQNIGFIEKEMYFATRQRGSNNKNL